MRGREVLEHVQAFAEVGADRCFNDFAAGLGHQATHAGKLLHLTDIATSTGDGHQVHRVEVLESAIANAAQMSGVESENLVVHEAYADEGATMKRWRPRSMGRAFPRFKRSCHLSVALAAVESEGVAPTADVEETITEEAVIEEAVAEEAVSEEDAVDVAEDEVEENDSGEEADAGEDEASEDAVAEDSPEEDRPEEDRPEEDGGADEDETEAGAAEEEDSGGESDASEDSEEEGDSES